MEDIREFSFETAERDLYQYASLLQSFEAD
jgi:hypothetical protein